MPANSARWHANYLPRLLSSSSSDAIWLPAGKDHCAPRQFESDFFQQNLLRIVDDVVSVIKGSIELWPTLVEICYFQKGRKGFPQVRLNNQKKRE